MAVVCAVSWNEVALKWNQILTIFKNAFSVSSKNMTSAFSTTRNQVVQQIQKSPAITNSFAKVIMYGNNQQVGCFASEQKYAKGLCGGNDAICHNVHDIGEGFFSIITIQIIKNFIAGIYNY